MSNVNHKSAKQRISDRIKAGQIAGRLEKFALSKKGDKDFDKNQMSAPQVTAAFKLLAKVVPDLKQIEMKGGLDLKATVTSIKRTIVEPGHTDS